MSATCRNCGEAIVEKYAGTYWKAPDPMPMMWVHLTTDDRACGYADPDVSSQHVECWYVSSQHLPVECWCGQSWDQRA